MDTVLEQTRAGHEDMERLERMIVLELRKETKSHNEKLQQSLKISRYIDMIQDNAKKLINIYKDEDKSRIEEIQTLTGGISGFYQRNEEIRKYHRQFPSLEITEGDDQMNNLLEHQGEAAVQSIQFTGEEGYGRYLDLNQNYSEYVNGKFGKQIEYLEYLQVFYFFDDIPRLLKMSKSYRKYLETLFSYLLGFYQRTQSLGDINAALQQLGQEFEQEFGQGLVQGWEDRGMGQQSNQAQEDGAQVEILNLDDFTSRDDLEQVDMEKLKESLQALGLKVGGTQQQRAERLWQTKGISLSDLDPRLFQKGKQPQLPLPGTDAKASNGVPTSNGVSTANGIATPATNAEVSTLVIRPKLEQQAFEIALLENKVQKLCEVLGGVIDDTKGQVEKKQAQTAEERMAEQEEGNDIVLQEDSDSEDEVVYNPLKLPLGWDGKPIPYWLYKLHGLNQEYKCEICGNYSYWGRRAFEKHFKEWRHQNAMSALGIPNTKTFYEITRIEDALSLLKNLQVRNQGGKVGDDIEEYEDEEGNVYNRKTFTDLKRQGIIS